MDDAVSSFGVHVQSLVDFAQRLREQLGEIQRPVRAVTEITARPELPLGSFAEAFSFSDDHADLAAAMSEVLGKVNRAVEFTANATRIVADRYQTLGSAGAQNIAASVGRAAPTVTGTASPQAGSLTPPDPARLVEVPVPAQGGTVYHYNGTSAQPVVVTVEAQSA